MTTTPAPRHLLVIEDQKSRRIVYLTENTYDLGRDSTSAIILYDRQVSRHHATLLRVNDYQNRHFTYRIIDGNLQGKRSTNGLMVNGQYCLSHELKHGDLISFGSKSSITYQVVLANTQLSPKPEEDIVPYDSTQTGEFEPVDLALSGASNSNLNAFDQDEFDLEVAPSQEQVFSTAILYASEIEESLEERHPTQQDNRMITLAELSPQAIVEITQEGHLLYFNAAAENWFPDLRTAQEKHPLFEGIFALAIDANNPSLERELTIGGKVFQQMVYVIPHKHLIRSYCSEVTSQRTLEKKYADLDQIHQLYRQLATEGIFIVDAATKQIIDSNLTYQQLLGFSQADMATLTLYQVVASTPAAIDQVLVPLLTHEMIIWEEAQHQRRDGKRIRVGAKIHRQSLDGRTVYCFIVRDLQEQQATEAQLQQTRLQDPIILIPNRLLFQQSLTTAIAKAKTSNHRLGVIFIHLSTLQHLNQSYGYRLGDEVQKHFYQALQSCLLPSQVSALWQNGTFAVLLPQIKQVEEVTSVADRILERLKLPLSIANKDFLLSTVMGISLYPDDGETMEALVTHADLALQQIRQEGHNQYQFYNPKFSTEALFQARMEQLLEQAIAKKQFHLLYQPQFNLATGTITGLEVFLRWEHPDVGNISPNRFLPVAVQSNLIFEISDWILIKACQQNLAWQKDRLPPVPVTVNFSIREFYRQDLATVVAQILAQTGLDPRWLELEITEAVLRHDPSAAQKSLKDLRSLGVRIALDDFGTGTSSLGFISQFDLQTIKLGQQLIRGLRGTPQEKGIIAAIVAFGQGLQCRVVAEGLETEEQFTLLSQLNCPEAQGYRLGKPLRSKEITTFLQTKSRH